MFLSKKSDMNEMDHVRTSVKRTIESFEHWSRRLINDELSASYGDDYFSYEFEDGNRLIKNDIIRLVDGRMKEDPERFPRKIDAILLENIAYFFCKEDFYNNFFKPVFDGVFAGEADIRLRIERIAGIRNKLNHGNSISFREAEQASCYCNDFVEAYKLYYQKVGRDKEYNAPFFTKAEDSLGRCQYRQDDRIADFSSGVGIPKMRPGDVYKIWVEVDSNFPEDFYEITWFMHDKAVGTGTSFEYTIKVKDVTDLLFVSCSLKSKREWHKYKSHDDSFTTCFAQVLPPVEDLY